MPFLIKLLEIYFQTPLSLYYGFIITSFSAALLSSLISQLLTLILLQFPPSSSPTITPPPHSIQHLITTSNLAACLPFTRKRKRKREHDSHAGSGSGSRSTIRTRILRNPSSFNHFFKMKSTTFEWLCGLLEPLLDCRDPIGSDMDLTVEIRLGIGLLYLGTGADYDEIATRFGVTEVESVFCVKQLIRVLCTNYRFWVGFPGRSELDSVSDRFESMTGLPNCCGVVNCVRFDDEVGSIAAQVVVDSSSRILSVVAGFSGDRSDFLILKSSSLFKDIENGVILDRAVEVDGVSVPQYLVGDGEYALLPWLLLPFDEPEKGSVEDGFNRALSLMRVSSLRAVASLRSWGVLSGRMKGERKMAVACVGACCILHNMLIMREDYSAFCDEVDDKELNGWNGVRLGGNVVEEKALVVRRALATRAKESLG